jgi:glycosyltransferase involved in cell wall biosynthesis
MNEADELTFAVMITTRNRRDELRITLSRLLELQPQPDEILICADGCTDGTGDMIRREFPTCTLIENESPRGSVFSRDRLLRASRSDLVASFDDDSYPVDRDFFSRAKHLFEKRSEVAVLSFPEIRDDGSFANSTKTTSSPSHLVSAYANCAAVMRREVYLQSGGFPTFFGHMYEEPDFALQCYGLGKIVSFEPTLSVRHHVSERQREPIKRHHLNARNELWSVWLRCPWPWLPLVSIFRMWRQFRYACSEGWRWALQEPVWWFRAFLGLPKCLRQRSPIAWKLYYGWMRLTRQPDAMASPIAGPDTQK